MNPQPDAAAVVHALLAWIDEVDRASQRGESKPPFCRPDGAPIFPPDDTWWLTSFEKRRTQEPGMDLAGEDVADEDLTIDAADAGVASSDTSSSETVDDEEADLQSRSAVSRKLKESVASLFAQARTRKSVASSAKDIAAEPTPASEFVHCRLEQIHEYEPEVRAGVKCKDPQMTTVDDEAAQPEKQPTEAPPQPQPRRPGLTLRCWPGKTEKSSS